MLGASRAGVSYGMLSSFAYDVPDQMSIGLAVPKISYRQDVGPMYVGQSVQYSKMASVTRTRKYEYLHLQRFFTYLYNSFIYKSIPPIRRPVFCNQSTRVITTFQICLL